MMKVRVLNGRSLVNDQRFSLSAKAREISVRLTVRMPGMPSKSLGFCVRISARPFDNKVAATLAS